MRYTVPRYNGGVTDQERGALLEAARKYIGVRFLHRGRSAQGLDCVGELIVPVYDVLGVWVEVTDYPEWPNPQIMRDICNKIMLPKKRGDLIPGDVALMYASGLGVVHLGWYAGRTLIHANNESDVQKVVETSIHPDWNLRGTYTVPRYEK